MGADVVMAAAGDPLLEAVKEGSLGDVERLVNQEGPDRLATLADEQEFGRSPLMWAAVRGHLQVMEFIIRSVDVDQKDELGRSGECDSSASPPRHAACPHTCLRRTI
jgi:ankyrin repeat protein